MSTSVRRIVAVISGLVLFVAGAATSAAWRQHASSAERAPVQLPAFDRAVFLSHVNDPARTPLFPGDPAFSIHTVFTMPDDGFYLELVREGAHTGTHYSAPCHFHDGALCMDDLSPSDLVLPAVVVDVRDEVVERPGSRRARGGPAGVGGRVRSDAGGRGRAAAHRMLGLLGARRSQRRARTTSTAGPGGPASTSRGSLGTRSGG